MDLIMLGPYSLGKFPLISLSMPISLPLDMPSCAMSVDEIGEKMYEKVKLQKKAFERFTNWLNLSNSEEYL